MLRSITATHPPHVLREYSLIADGERGALVGPRGDIAWMCAPQWHDDAVFASLLGVESAYVVAPREDRYVWGGRYEEGSLIWRSRWVTVDGIIECRDALAFPGEEKRAVILRRILAVSGPARVGVLLAPRAEFGRFGLSRLNRRGTVWEGRCGPLYLRWSGAEAATAQDHGTLALHLELPPGAHHDLVLELSTVPYDQPAADPDLLWESTEHAWADGGCRRCQALHRRAARHDQHEWRDGCRRDDVPARARRRGSQLRLPLRLDSRPVLRRPSRGGERGSRPARLGCALCRRAAAR